MFDHVIYAYSRANAIEDGVLVDVTEMAKEPGFKIPVAVTSVVWRQYIWKPEDTQRQTYQDEKGRLWDILWMLYLACRRHNNESDLLFKLHVIPRSSSSRRRRPVPITFKSTCGPGDSGAPVITVMLPDED